MARSQSIAAPTDVLPAARSDRDHDLPFEQEFVQLFAVAVSANSTGSSISIDGCSATTSRAIGSSSSSR